MARDKDRTKTSEDRLVDLCPRALQILKRHLALRTELKLQGKIDHDDLFFKDDGAPIRNLQYPWVRWKRTLQGMKVRYREPYNARRSSVSWNLMIGKNPLWLAKQHGHSATACRRCWRSTRRGRKARKKRTLKRSNDQTGNAVVVANAPSYRETNSTRRPASPRIWH